MTAKFSSGLNNKLLGGKGWRELFCDCVVEVYSGAVPATADAAPGGTKLCRYTKSGGTVSVGERSVPKIHHVTIPDSHASGATVKLNVTVDGVGPTTYTYTNTPDLDAAPMMVKVAQMINDIPQLIAVPDVTAREMYVMSRIDGLDFTLVDGGGSVTATVDAAVQAASRADTLQFGLPGAVANSQMDKNADTWQGTTIAPGTAAFFRVVGLSDSGALSTTDVRIQGSVSTSGADMNLPSINYVAYAVNILNSGSIILPITA